MERKGALAYNGVRPQFYIIAGHLYIEQKQALAKPDLASASHSRELPEGGFGRNSGSGLPLPSAGVPDRP